MKVFPKNDDIRRVLIHPVAGKFRAEGAADWPDDSFTQRRIKDGDVYKEGGGDPQSQQKSASQQHHAPRKLARDKDE
jgi:hypothetical protein